MNKLRLLIVVVISSMAIGCTTFEQEEYLLIDNITDEYRYYEVTVYNGNIPIAYAIYDNQRQNFSSATKSCFEFTRVIKEPKVYLVAINRIGEYNYIVVPYKDGSF